MRKEIIIRTHVKSDKRHAKAMKVAASCSGVESVTLAGEDRNLLLVIRVGVDSNKLLQKLKKKVGEAEIVELRTHDMFKAAPLPGTKQEHSYIAESTSPYSYRSTSPYSYYYPSGVGGYGYDYGHGAGGAAVSSYSQAVAHMDHSPMVDRHDYQPMDHSSSSSGKRRQTTMVPGDGTNSCTIH